MSIAEATSYADDVQVETETETELQAEDSYWSEIAVTDGTYTDYGVQIEVPQAKKDEFLAAYRKDMKTLSFAQIYTAMNALQVQTQSNRGTYDYDRYPLSQNFTNAVRVLEEIAQEDNTEDFSVVYG